MNEKQLLAHILTIQCSLRKFVLETPGASLAPEGVRQLMCEFVSHGIIITCFIIQGSPFQSKINVELDKRNYGPHSADDFLRLCQEIVENRLLPPRQRFVNIVTKWQLDGVFDDVQEDSEGSREQGAPIQGKDLKGKHAVKNIEMNDESRKRDVVSWDAQNKESDRETDEEGGIRKSKEKGEAKKEDDARQEQAARKMQEAARKMKEEAEKMEEEAMQMEAAAVARKRRVEASKEEAIRKEEEEAAKKNEGKGMEDTRNREARKEQGPKGREEKQKPENDGIGKEPETRLRVKRTRFADSESLATVMKDSWRGSGMTNDESLSEVDEAKEMARGGTTAPPEVDAGDTTGHRNAERKRKASKVLDSHDDSSGKGPFEDTKVKRRTAPQRSSGNVVKDDIIAEKEKDTGKKPSSAQKKSITVTLPHPCVYCNAHSIPCTMTNTSDNRRSCDNCHASKRKCGIIKNKIFLKEKAKERSVFGSVAARMLKAVEDNEHAGGRDEDDMEISDEGESAEFSSKIRR